MLSFWDKLKANTEKMAALSSIYDSAGFQVVLDVMEQICNETENDFIGTKPSAPQEVLAGHAVMHAQRKFFYDTAVKIDYLAAEQRGLSEKKDTASKRTTSLK